MRLRTRSSAALAVLAGGAAALALGGCFIDIGQLQHHTRSYQAAAPVRALVVSNRVGDVSVTGGAGRVTVTERIRYRHELPHSTHVTRAGTLTLTDGCPLNETCTVDYDVRVPRGITVSVSDSAGTIRLTSLAGRISAHTDAGNITLRSLSGTVRVSTHAGSVSGSGLSPATAVLRTNAGNIDAAFSAAPASVIATSSAGNVSLRLPGGVAYAVQAGASVGTTHVTVPQSARSAHHVTARTRTGSVTVGPG